MNEKFGNRRLAETRHSKLEKVVVGVAGVVVDALFDFENMYREDRSFTVAQTVLPSASSTFLITILPSGEVSVP